MKSRFQIIRHGAWFLGAGPTKAMFSLRHFRLSPSHWKVARDNTDFPERETIEQITRVSLRNRLIASLFSPLTLLKELTESARYFFKPYRKEKDLKRDYFSLLTRIGKLALITITLCVIPILLPLSVIKTTQALLKPRWRQSTKRQKAFLLLAAPFITLGLLIFSSLIIIPLVLLALRQAISIALAPLTYFIGIPLKKAITHFVPSPLLEEMPQVLENIAAINKLLPSKLIFREPAKEEELEAKEKTPQDDNEDAQDEEQEASQEEEEEEEEEESAEQPPVAQPQEEESLSLTQIQFCELITQVRQLHAQYQHYTQHTAPEKKRESGIHATREADLFEAVLAQYTADLQKQATTLPQTNTPVKMINVPQPLLQAITCYLECFTPACNHQQLETHTRSRAYYAIFKGLDTRYYREERMGCASAKNPSLPIEIHERLLQENLPVGHNAHAELVRQTFLRTIENKDFSDANKAGAISIPTVSKKKIDVPLEVAQMYRRLVVYANPEHALVAARTHSAYARFFTRVAPDIHRRPSHLSTDAQLLASRK